VQGVWFRASTAERAAALGLRGRAENLPDGSVLVHVAGAAASVEALVQWLHRGPPMARVDAVEVEVMEPAGYEWPKGFVQS
jgi:acylphosphatase